MGFYNVVRPCVVGKLHYASVPVQPIEVDDEVAAELVESGDLTPYAPGSGPVPSGEPTEYAPAGALAEVFDSLNPETVDDEPAETEKPAPRARGRRKAAED